jgi:hypothetical protein
VLENLPRVRCVRREFGEVSADPAAAPWCDLPAIPLCETITGASPSQGTLVKVAWDAADLRVLFQAADEHAWATMTARDAPLYEEEVVEVFLDPVGDLESYFEIEVNPLNAVLDLVLRKNRSGYAKNSAWQCEGLRTAVTKNDVAWTTELAIPFRALTSAPPVLGTRWRVNFFRIDRPQNRERELSAWTPTRSGTFHRPERFGVLEFADA